MTEAIFGLLGVVIGSLITWLVEVWRARRGDSDEGRVAARLVIDELRTIENVRTVGEDEFAQQRKLALSQDAWRQHRAVLARELTRRLTKRQVGLRRAVRTAELNRGREIRDRQWEKAMGALEPLATRHRYWWQRLWARLTEQGERIPVAVGGQSIRSLHKP